MPRLAPRHRNWLLILGALALVALFDVLRAPAAVETGYFQGPKPLVIARQGGMGLRPGNTLLAFQHSVELGADVLQADVRATRDGALVLMDAGDVAATTDGYGAVADLTGEEIGRLDAAYRWTPDGDDPPYRGRGVGVPSLDEALLRFPGARFRLDIRDAAAATGEAVCTVVKRAGAEARVLVEADHAQALHAFRRSCPRVPVGADGGQRRWLGWQYRLGLWRIVQPRVAALSVRGREAPYRERAFLGAAAEEGLHVEVWATDEAADLPQLASSASGGIVTGRPDQLLDLLGRRQPRR